MAKFIKNFSFIFPIFQFMLCVVGEYIFTAKVYVDADTELHPLVANACHHGNVLSGDQCN